MAAATTSVLNYATGVLITDGLAVVQPNIVSVSRTIYTTTAHAVVVQKKTMRTDGLDDTQNDLSVYVSKGSTTAPNQPRQ